MNRTKSPLSKRRFSANCEKLLRTQPTEVVWLKNLAPENIDLSLTKGQVNLYRKTPGFFLHDPKQMQKELQDLMGSVNEKVELLVCIGAGAGYFFESALVWLNQNRKRTLIFLEPDLEVLYYLLHLPLGSAILSHPRVKLLSVNNGFDEDDEEIRRTLAWQGVEANYQVVALPSYTKAYPDDVHEWTERISQMLEDALAIWTEYSQLGLAFYSNFYPNLKSWEHAYHVKGFQQAFKGVPAIISGAGPSLAQNGAELIKAKGKALVFAGGSSLNALLHLGVMPDFGAGVDPFPAQWDRLKGSKAFKGPFFFRNRIQTQALQEVQGPKVYVPGASGYDTAAFLEEKVRIEPLTETIDDGLNVVHFCTNLALYMGCNPIIFTGLDLSYTNNKTYSEGVEANNQLEDDPRLITRKDIFGRPVKTKWMWIAEQHWMESFVKAHPDTTFINATEGGLGFSNIPNEKLKTVLQGFKEKYSSEDLTRILSLSEIKIPRKDIVSACDELKKDALETMKEIDQLISIVETLKDPKYENASLRLDPLFEMSLLENKISEHEAFRAIATMFNISFIQARQKELHKIPSDFEMSPFPTWKKAVKLQIERLTFLYRVLDANQSLIDFYVK